MSIKKRGTLTILAYLVSFFVLGPIANLTWDAPVSITSTMLFCALCILWTVGMMNRVIGRREKRYFVFLGLFMLLWLIERAVKFSPFLSSERVERMLWYGYYIPIILMPLLSLMLALCFGKTEKEKVHPKVRLLYLPAGLLIALFLSNDVHQLAFRFRPGSENWVDNYSYGALYYLAIAWIVGCVLAALMITVRFSTVNGTGKSGLLPLGVILLALAGVGVYVFTDYRHTRIMNVPELFCFCVASFWEACLQTGLIPSNTGYDLLFKNSHLCASIIDEGGKTVYQTSMQKDSASIKHTQRITGGSVTWFEDISVINKQKEMLEQANAKLSKKAELQQKENALKEERTLVREQEKIYNRINASLLVQTEHIRTLTLEVQTDPEKWKTNMLWVCVIGAFMKRKSTLMLLAANNERLPLAELGLAFGETAFYLESAGVTCSLCKMPDVFLPSGVVLYAYDELEKVIESKLPDLRSVRIRVIEKEKSVLFDIQMDATPLMFEFEKGARA